MDDGSDPPFLEESNDPRVRLIRRTVPSGPCGARNTGLEAARGEWIAFLDDDDWLAPSLVETSLAAASASRLPLPVAVLSGMRVVDGDGGFIEFRLPNSSPKGHHYFLGRSSMNGEEVTEADHSPARLGDSSPITRSYKSHNTLIAPVDVIRNIGGWDESLLAWEHDDFFLRLNAVCSIQGTDAVLYTKIKHQYERRSDALRDRVAGMERTARKHRDLFRSHPHRHAHYLARISYLYLIDGKWWRAIAASSRSLAANPSEVRLLRYWFAALLGPLLFGKVRPNSQRELSGRRDRQSKHV